MSYQLTPDDIDNSRDDEPPASRAAKNPNPAVLQALLAYYNEICQDAPTNLRRHNLERYSPNASVSGAIWGIYETPLTAAIRANLPHNIQTLLKAGADPSGISAFELSDYAVRFIRGRDPKIDTSSFAHCPPRATVLAGAHGKGITAQTAPLTAAEIEERRGGASTVLDRAECSRSALADECGLDGAGGGGGDGGYESAWLTQEGEEEGGEMVELSKEAGEALSALSTSSPVHQALQAGRLDMLRHLLAGCGYSPNYRPRAAPTVALPPASFAIARCDLRNPGVQRCLVELLAHPKLNLCLRTPVFDVHVLHFAAARYDPDLLGWLAGHIPGGLKAAGTTALGHTLLHIACLPLTADQIVSRNPALAKSIHCARTLDTAWLPHRLPSPLHMRFASPGQLGGNPRPMSESEQRGLSETVGVILEDGAVDVRAQDTDGNTALHYLAGTLNMDEEVVRMVRGMEMAEGLWERVRNEAGFTPGELWGE
ncbi:hypothetical protein Aspvir_009743 [Aspergillus viridinutans]|uniref:Ankyrin n=1 Tax=Aspergillus viridinutans TaxID=75553 RepID=A0A9P3BYZ5_ASPVI|nr:uncharacterized protein Aspvir_009743 [Aspergillus viridinutans]GIK05630.1 hypothetical protein Aspvir_009743 [Aspergillus viridinutans]